MYRGFSFQRPFSTFGENYTRRFKGTETCDKGRECLNFEGIEKSIRNMQNRSKVYFATHIVLGKEEQMKISIKR
jgi:hypothetical protein